MRENLAESQTSLMFITPHWKLRKFISSISHDTYYVRFGGHTLGVWFCIRPAKPRF